MVILSTANVNRPSPGQGGLRQDYETCSGRNRMKVVPLPFFTSISIQPAFSSMISLTVVRPRPVPFSPLVVK